VIGPGAGVRGPISYPFHFRVVSESARTESIPSSRSRNVIGPRVIAILSVKALVELY